MHNTAPHEHTSHLETPIFVRTLNTSR